MATFLNMINLRSVPTSARYAVRGLCSFTVSSIERGDIKKSVFVSQSKDIFTNLALEDWLYRNFDFTNHHVMLLWQNDPCVVIGRHQNPWLEVNVPELASITGHGVKLARRNSGGGTVYHDPGNLNITFFTPRDHYNRNRNLQLITGAVFREFGTKLDISKKDDLTLHSCKVSGTAAKLGRPNSYHHCTLLVDVNKADLSRALQKLNVDIQTNATESTRSKIINLCENNLNVSVQFLLRAVAREYLRVPSVTDEGFRLVDATDQQFPGISEIRSNLESWQWRYGKTPKFNISRSFAVPGSLSGIGGDSRGNFKVTISVESGRVSNIEWNVSPGLTSSGLSSDVIVTNLTGCKFPEDALDHLNCSIERLASDKEKFVADCVKQIMTFV